MTTETQTHTTWRTGRRLGDDKEGSIAIIADDGQYIGCTDAMLEGRYDEARNKANAQLWAAAPELLDALRNLLGTSGHYLAPDEGLATDFDCPNSWIKQARAAIKKGETQ